jgi:TonB family protein
MPQSELGKWWKNSEIVKKLDLTQNQVVQIEQSFLDHQHKLADANAQLKQQEAYLSTLLQSDQVNDFKVRSQIERVASARAALEKTNAFMMLSIRKNLSKEQWSRLQEIQTVPVSAADARIPGRPAPGAESLPNGVYAPGGDVQAPKVIYRRMPHYTQAARDAKAEGTVLLEAIVRKNGSIDSFKVLRSLGYGLDESALNTIKKDWKFEPGTRNGKPVDVKIVVETSFRLY